MTKVTAETVVSESAGQLEVGQRCEVHPATNAWIFGDRCGEITKLGRKWVHVKMDRSGRTLRFHRSNIWKVMS